MTSENGMLHKDEVLQCLKETRNQLHRTEREIVLIIRFEKLINKPECCIFDWIDISNFYSDAKCLLQRAIPFFVNDNGMINCVNKHVELLVDAEKASLPNLHKHVKYCAYETSVSKEIMDTLTQEMLGLGFF